MFHRCHHLALLALMAGGLAIAGCSDKTSATRPTTGHAATTHASPTSGTNAAPAKPKTGTVTSSGGKPLPSSTGIPACDDYLSSYVACHAAAGVYTPDQIQSRYQDMRTSLLQDSVDPNVRPQLGARCTALAAQMRETLHGKSCAPVSPAPSGTH